MISGIAHLGLLDDEQIAIDLAALALSALDHPGVDLEPYLALFGAIEAELAMAVEAVTALEQAAVLARVIAGQHGFTGDRDTYDAPLNADMIRVIDRRRGLPISLSILYVAQARRVGWSAEVLNIPGHVLVRIGPADASVVIDPFNDGALVDSDQIVALLSQMVSPQSPFDEESVAPMTNRMILTRLLRNQASRAELANDLERARIVNERIVTVAPSEGRSWWDLARFQAAAGQSAEARTSLSAMLEITRDRDQRAKINAAIEALGTG